MASGRSRRMPLALALISACAVGRPPRDHAAHSPPSAAARNHTPSAPPAGGGGARARRADGAAAPTRRAWVVAELPPNATWRWSMSVEEAIGSQFAPWLAAGGIRERHLAAARRSTVPRLQRLTVAPRGAPASELELTSKDKGQKVHVKRALLAHPSLRPARPLDLFVTPLDWPEFPVREAAASGLPAVFGIQNNGGFLEVLLPTHTRGQFGHGFEAARAELLALADAAPWRARPDRAIWRGSLGCAVGCGARGDLYYPANHAPRGARCAEDVKKGWDPAARGRAWGCETLTGLWRRHQRVRLVELSVNGTCGEHGGGGGGGGAVLDARFSGYNEHSRFVKAQVGERTASSWLGPRIPEQQLAAAARLYVHVGNNGFADRLWRLLALGFTLLIVEPGGWREFYYGLLAPWVHYVPVAADLSDLCARIAWARAHPERAEAIAAAGRRVVLRQLDVRDVDLYVGLLLRAYGSLVEMGARADAAERRGAAGAARSTRRRQQQRRRGRTRSSPPLSP